MPTQAHLYFFRAILWLNTERKQRRCHSIDNSGKTMDRECKQQEKKCKQNTFLFFNTNNFLFTLFGLLSSSLPYSQFLQPTSGDYPVDKDIG